MRIKCYCNLYVSDALKTRQNKVLKDLMEGRFRSGLSVITLARGRQNHLEFFSPWILKQHYFNDTELFIVGLADGYGEAVHLIKDITQEVLDMTGGTDIRGYITEQQNKFEESRA